MKNKDLLIEKSFKVFYEDNFLSDFIGICIFANVDRYDFVDWFKEQMLEEIIDSEYYHKNYYIQEYVLKDIDLMSLDVLVGCLNLENKISILFKIYNDYPILLDCVLDYLAQEEKEW